MFRAVLAVVLIGFATASCASVRHESTSRRAHYHWTHRSTSRSHETWLQTGADGLALAQEKLHMALHRVYEAWAGTPYVWGGDTKKGVDCSSFVQQSMDKIYSVELPRTTEQLAKVGKSIPRADLKAGDLVFFRTGPDTRHVGIYIGNGRFMDASSSKGVTISRLNNAYWRAHYWQSRRVVADTEDVSYPSQL